ncbi:MAG TPA: hypothetical protein VKH82_02730 [Candidatus Binatia bacterium]|nr:hypothetical protein [Candidatus Binatia bacterium]
MFESKKAGRMWAVVVAATVLATGAAHAQSLGACRLAACGSLGTVAQVPVQFVSPPDMAVQFSTCLDSSAVGSFVSGLHDSLAAEMHDLDVNHDDPPPNPDVRHACINGKSTFGGWLEQPYAYGSSDTATARNVGLGTVNALLGDETFAFTFRPIGISRLVQIRWQDQPKQLNDDGYPDSGGAVHLTDYDLYFNSYSVTADPPTGAILQGPTVDLAINGWYDGPFSNTDFTLDVLDFPSHTQYGDLRCETVSGAHPTETTVDTVLASLTGGAGGSLGDVVGGGPGCKIARGLSLSRTVLVPKTPLKVVFNYSRVTSDTSSGLTFGGKWDVLQRQPSVTIQGPTLIKAEDGDPFSGIYVARTTDLRPPFTVSWISRDGSPVSGQNKTSTTMVWNLPGLAVGQKTSRALTVTVTDADGATASGFKEIFLSRVQSTDPGLNPPCDKKPWLPQCKD